jgi:1-acyl-sn-glycerol-3-phosphate acyltransferase
MRVLQAIFFILIIRPLIMVIIGLNIQGKEHLPGQGPAIIAANHNSHLDTLVLLSLWPLNKLWYVRPVAAADYFLTNKALAWFSLNIMNIIPIDRRRVDVHGDPLAKMSETLKRGEILILYPEGSRGKPEEMGRFKTGISRLVERHPDVPIIPIFMHGLGKALPKGDFLLVPFFCDVIIGQPLYWQGSIKATMQSYEDRIKELAQQHELPAWE